MSCISFICPVKFSCLSVLLCLIFPLNPPQGPPFAPLLLPPHQLLFPSLRFNTICSTLAQEKAFCGLCFQLLPEVSSLFAWHNPRGLLRMFSGMFSHGNSKESGLSVVSTWGFHLKYAWSALSENPWVWRLGVEVWGSRDA